MTARNNNYRVFNDNCLDILKKMKDDSVDYILTSPPYNRKRNDKYDNYKDKLEPLNYQELLNTSISECLRVCNGHIFYNIQKTFYNKAEVFQLFSTFNDYLVDVIIWGKTNPTPSSGGSVTNAYEFIFVFHKEKKPLKIKSDTQYIKNLIITNVYAQNPYKSIHRAVMHPDIAEHLITNFTEENSIVMDIFMGVGTTGVAARQNNRKFIGAELNEEYFNICKSRLEEIDNEVKSNDK